MNRLGYLNAGDCLGFINDTHISNEDIQAFRINWKESIDILYQRGIKHQIVGGDLFQSRFAQSLLVLKTVEECLEYADSKAIHVTLLNGNHDKVNQEDNYGYCHIFQHRKNVTVIDVCAYFESDTANIFLLAYFPEQGSLAKKIDTIVNSDVFNNGKRNILYGHAGVMGALTKDNPDKEIAKESFDKFDAIYMGHYHCKTKTGKVEYIGASRQYNYGENYIKGYNICDAHGDLEFVQNKVNNRMVTIDVSFEGISSIPDIVEDIKNKHTDCLGKIMFKCRIKCTKAQMALINKEQIRDMGINKIESVNIIEKTSDVKTSFYKKYDKDQIKKSYQSFCNEKGKNADLGLKYLNK